jgi:nucleoside 2-deoxyribosyltransferase
MVHSAKSKIRQMSIQTRPKRQKSRLYIAAPLFSLAEKAFNVKVRRLLEPYFETYLPQEDGILLANIASTAQNVEDINSAKESIFQGDLSAINTADLLLAILDGRAIDEGTAFELGFAYAIGKPCFGLQTDPRRLLPYGNNPMIDQSLTQIFDSLDELKSWAIRYTSTDSEGNHL